jgi:radical SAM protein with 4Fe4S-binding SPASM domain
LSAREPRCPDEADGSVLLSHVQEWAFKNTIPLNASIEVTLRCNIRCLHCYNFDRDQPKPSCNKPELSTEEILKLMDDLRAAGCLFISLTGGEVLSHPDLFQFLDHARQLNLSVQLLTNGTMLRQEVAERLASYQNLSGISVSLYGATARVHDAITQMPGSFQRTWDGITRMRQLGVTVRLKFIVMAQNAHEVEAMKAEADARGLPYLVDLTITQRHDGSKGSLVTRLSRETLDDLFRGPLYELGLRQPVEYTDENASCNCARGNVGITATGDVVPCISVPWTAGNIREQAFAEIWKSSPVFQRIRGLKLSDYEDCQSCGDQPYCRRSRGAALTASGSYTGIDPFICVQAEITHRIADERAAGVDPRRPGPIKAPPRLALTVVR